MPSPFPGLDPYLEQFWGDVHTAFMVYARDQISDQLPADLQARIEESLSVDHDEGSRTVYPDASIVELPLGNGALQATSHVAVAEPILIPLPDELPTHRHIEIIDRNSGNRVVTVIELLSPANKTSKAGVRAYLSKQEEYVAARVNIVEIDLIRDGSFVLAVPESKIPSGLTQAPLICISRAYGRNLAEVYPAPLRERLPNVRIPLRQQDQDAILQLQPLFDECYHRGRYSSVNYKLPPIPALSEEDERWADGLLRERGFR